MARKGCGCGGVTRPSLKPPHRLAQRVHPERHEDAWDAHGQVRRLPSLEAEWGEGGVGVSRIPAADDPAADEDADAGADVDAARIDGEHGGAHPGGEVVGQHGESGWRGARLADPHAHAVGGERAEAARRSRQCSHQAPEAKTDGDEILARPGVRQLAERDAEDGVEDGERSAVEEANLRIGNADVGFDLLGQDGDDLPVDEVEDVDDDENDGDVPGIAPTNRRRPPLLRLRHSHPPFLSGWETTPPAAPRPTANAPCDAFACDAAQTVVLFRLAKQQGVTVGVAGHGLAAYLVAEFVVGAVVEVGVVHEFEAGGLDFLDRADGVLSAPILDGF